MTRNITGICLCPNRRLYDYDGGGYITFGEISRRLRQGQEIVIRNRVTGEDVTSMIIRKVVASRLCGGLDVPIPELIALLQHEEVSDATDQEK